MRVLVRHAGLLVVIAAAAGCVDNPLFCDDKKPCAAPGATCVLHECVTGGTAADLLGSDAALDASTTDLPVPVDSAATDDAADLAGVDLAGSCRGNGDCADRTRPTCDGAAHQCRPCAASIECDSLVCNDDGTCAAVGDVVYTDNQGGRCAGANHAGTRADPVCEVADAVPLANARRGLIHVAGSTQSYQPILLTGARATLLIVGPGAAAVPAATIAGQGGSAVSLGLAVNALARLQLDGFIVQGDANSSAPVVGCVGRTTNLRAASIRLRRVRVLGGGGGVSAIACTVTVEDSTVRDSRGDGIAVSGALTVRRASVLANQGAGVKLTAPGAGASSSYELTNDIIGDNKGGGVDVEDASGAGTFSFNTVFNNGRNGVSCGGVFFNAMGDTMHLENSIVWGNQINNASQVCGCSFSQVVINEMNLPNAVYLDQSPDFVDYRGMNYRLKPASLVNRAYLVDKVLPSDGGVAALIADDIDGTARPQGKGWDIGAHEVE